MTSGHIEPSISASILLCGIAWSRNFIWITNGSCWFDTFFLSSCLTCRSNSSHICKHRWLTFFVWPAAFSTLSRRFFLNEADIFHRLSDQSIKCYEPCSRYQHKEEQTYKLCYVFIFMVSDFFYSFVWAHSRRWPELELHKHLRVAHEAGLKILAYTISAAPNADALTSIFFTFDLSTHLLIASRRPTKSF